MAGTAIVVVRGSRQVAETATTSVRGESRRAARRATVSVGGGKLLGVWEVRGGKQKERKGDRYGGETVRKGMVGGRKRLREVGGERGKQRQGEWKLCSCQVSHRSLLV